MVLNLGSEQAVRTKEGHNLCALFANSTREESGVLTSTRPVQRQARVNHSVDVSFATVAGNAALANRTLTISLYK